MVAPGWRETHRVLLTLSALFAAREPTLVNAQANETHVRTIYHVTQRPDNDDNYTSKSPRAFAQTQKCTREARGAPAHTLASQRATHRAKQARARLSPLLRPTAIPAKAPLPVARRSRGAALRPRRRPRRAYAAPTRLTYAAMHAPPGACGSRACPASGAPAG